MRITSGIYRGRNLIVPKGDAVRPTSDRMRQAMFNILTAGRFLDSSETDIEFDLDGAFVLDAFCGTGALGLEAISRGAVGCVFIDKDKTSLNCARDNVANCKIDTNVHFLLQDSGKLGVKPGSVPQANLALLDPPSRKGLVDPALSARAKNGWMATSAIAAVAA